MDKIYKLTIEFKCRVNDDVTGIGEIESIENTRALLEELSQNDEALLEIYKLNLYNTFLHQLDEPEPFIHALKIKGFNEILQMVLEKMPKETAEYFHQLYSKNSLENEKKNFSEQKRWMVENQFRPLEVRGVSFEESKPQTKP
ncbi:MAG: hypothetical protein GY940_34530 [bacterium]|nr:hypothetical protein [bacterium]